MRLRFLALPFLLVILGFGTLVAQPAQSCTTGLCLQQMSCPNNGTTSVSGVVYAPNGNDPLPNVLVYVPNAPVDAFTAGVSCPVAGAPPSGQPVAGATTAADGSFTIPNMPVGTNIPLVIVSGRWRRQFTIPSTTACANTVLPSAPASSGTMPFASFPQNHAQGDIPLFAVPTGSADSVECVLRKVGIQDTEFTDPANGGRIQLYLGQASPGAKADSATPSESTLMSSLNNLTAYDVLMLPCEGTQYSPTSAELTNLVSFANAGGRIYASHYSYSWMWENPPFNTVANWVGNSSPTYADGTLASVSSSYSGGSTLTTWLNDVGASSGTVPAQIGLTAIKHDITGVNAPTQAWLTLNEPLNPVMQFVWDTPVPTTATPNPTQCGRVLFNEYHVENPTITSTGKTFPAECPAGTTLSAQEKLLEYSLFELTNDGGAFTLTPATQDFGTSAAGFNSAPETFTFTNNSSFSTSVSTPVTTKDFNIIGNTCGTVQGYASCQITVVYNPSTLGAETGTLTVTASGTTLTSALTGNGIPDIALSISSLTFGSIDVGATQTQSFQITNSASGAVAMPALALTGDYAASSNCPGTLGAGVSCTIYVTFKPTTNGTRTGSLALVTPVPGTPATLTGNGVDFTITASPASGSVIAGYIATTTTTTTPLSGFAGLLALTCSTTAPGTTCALSSNSFTPAAAVNTTVTITTTSQYAVVGYGGGVSQGWLAVLGLASGLLLWANRERLVRVALVALMVGVAGLGLTGCSGKLPAQNANYTAPGTYTFTITATDGFLSHSATYALTTTTK